MRPLSNDTLVLSFSPFPCSRFISLQEGSLHFGPHDTQERRIVSHPLSYRCVELCLSEALYPAPLARRFHIFMRRTTISHFSFLISHSNGAFIPNQGGEPPLGLTLPPSIPHLDHVRLLFPRQRIAFLFCIAEGHGEDHLALADPFRKLIIGEEYIAHPETSDAARAASRAIFSAAARWPAHRSSHGSSRSAPVLIHRAPRRIHHQHRHRCFFMHSIVKRALAMSRCLPEGRPLRLQNARCPSPSVGSSYPGSYPSRR